MSIYINRKKESAYSNDLIGHEVGEFTKDTISISIHYKLDVETNTLSYSSEVIKNWTYSDLPLTGKRVEGKKYKEVLFKGNYKECLDYCEKYIMSEGHWIQNPNDSFKKIFIQPIEQSIPELEYPQ